MSDEQSVSDGIAVSLNRYRDAVNSCPDVPVDLKGFALFLAWKSKETETDEGPVCTVPSVPRQLCKELGVGETKIKTMINELVANRWLRRHGRGSLMLTVPPVALDAKLQIEREYQWVTAIRMVVPWSKGSITAKRAENKAKALKRLEESRPLRPLKSPPPTLEVAPSALLKSPPPPYVKSPPPPPEVAPSALPRGASYMPTPESAAQEPSPKPPAVPPFGRRQVPGSSGPRPGLPALVADEELAEATRVDEGQQPQDAGASARGKEWTWPEQRAAEAPEDGWMAYRHDPLTDTEWDALSTTRPSSMVM